MPEPGQSLLHYRLVDKIGEGGMGVVWRAVDTSLGREVAIKTLPGAFAAEPERLARFEREARLLASLNHPHIAGIYGLHEAPGTGSAPATRFLAMELVPGEDLAAVLARGPLPLDRTIEIARQIAQAIEAAHESGVIHRDIKPANVRLTPSGEVKVLDFGLAKAHDAGTASDPMRSATVTSGGTMAGLILGTAAYMSPEQAAGQPTDRRADVWSFGVMLYEMLSHRRLFQGETVSHTLADVLRAPIDLDRLPAGTPPALRRLVARCLDRNRNRRLRDIGEARIVLEDVLADPEAGTTAEPVPAAGRKRLPWIVAALAVALAVVGFTWRAGSPSAAPEPTRRLSLEMPNGAFTRQGGGQSIAISSDGRRVVTFAGAGTDDMLYLRDLDAFEPRGIEGTSGGTWPVFSPDDRWIAFLEGTTLYKVRTSGGSPVVIGPVRSEPAGMFWADDGFLYTSFQGKLIRVPSAGGATQPIDVAENAGLRLVLPFVLPGSKVLLCNEDEAGGGSSSRLFALSLDTKVLEDLDMPGSNPRYLPTGHILFAQGEHVLVARFDAATLTITGSPSVVHPRAWVDQGQIQIAVSANGTVAYLPVGSGRKQTIVTVDLDGNVSPLFPEGLPFNSLSDPRVSHDGRKLALAVERSAVYTIDLDTRTPTLMTENGFYPVWSPDDREIAFTSSRGESYDVYRRPVDLSTPERSYLDVENNLRTADWTRQGTLVIRQEIPDKGMDLYAVPNVADPKMEVFLDGDDDELSPAVSPNGKWIAFVSNYSGHDEIYVTSFPRPSGRQKVSIQGGTSPTWAPNASALYYFEGNKLIEVKVETEPRLRVLDRRTLFEGGYTQYRWSRQYDIFPDGKRFLLVQNPLRNSIEVVTNWFAELRDTEN